MSGHLLRSGPEFFTVHVVALPKSTTWWIPRKKLDYAEEYVVNTQGNGSERLQVHVHQMHLYVVEQPNSPKQEAPLNILVFYVFLIPRNAALN